MSKSPSPTDVENKNANTSPSNGNNTSSSNANLAFLSVVQAGQQQQACDYWADQRDELIEGRLTQEQQDDIVITALRYVQSETARAALWFGFPELRWDSSELDESSLEAQSRYVLQRLFDEGFSNQPHLDAVGDPKIAAQARCLYRRDAVFAHQRSLELPEAEQASARAEYLTASKLYYSFIAGALDEFMFKGEYDLWRQGRKQENRQTTRGPRANSSRLPKFQPTAPSSRKVAKSGLFNDRNQCFCNSVLAALRSNQAFIQHMISQQGQQMDDDQLNDSTKSLRWTLSLVLADLADGNIHRVPANMHTFWDILADLYHIDPADNFGRFGDGNQHDASEFISSVLEGLFQRVLSLTFGLRVNIVRECQVCHNRVNAKRHDILYMLPIPDQGSIELETCLQNFWGECVGTHQEEIAVHCNNCGGLCPHKETGVAKLNEEHSDRALMVALNLFRFVSDSPTVPTNTGSALLGTEAAATATTQAEATGRTKKLQTKVNIPEGEFAVPGIKDTWFLQSVIVHRGLTSDSGHYFTYVRDVPREGHRHPRRLAWDLHNDENVTKDVPFARVSQFTPYIVIMVRLSQEDRDCLALCMSMAEEEARAEELAKAQQESGTADSVAVAEKAAADKAAADKAAADKATADKAAADQLAADKFTADKAAADQLAADKFTADKAAADKTTADKAAADQLAADKFTADKAAADKAAADKAAADKAAADDAKKQSPSIQVTLTAAERRAARYVARHATRQANAGNVDATGGSGETSETNANNASNDITDELEQDTLINDDEDDTGLLFNNTGDEDDVFYDCREYQPLSQVLASFRPPQVAHVPQTSTGEPSIRQAWHTAVTSISHAVQLTFATIRRRRNAPLPLLSEAETMTPVHLHPTHRSETDTSNPLPQGQPPQGETSAAPFQPSGQVVQSPTLDNQELPLSTSRPNNTANESEQSRDMPGLPSLDESDKATAKSPEHLKKAPTPSRIPRPTSRSPPKSTSPKGSFSTTGTGARVSAPPKTGKKALPNTGPTTSKRAASKTRGPTSQVDLNKHKFLVREICSDRRQGRINEYEVDWEPFWVRSNDLPKSSLTHFWSGRGDKATPAQESLRQRSVREKTRYGTTEMASIEDYNENDDAYLVEWKKTWEPTKNVQNDLVAKEYIKKKNDDARKKKEDDAKKKNEDDDNARRGDGKKDEGGDKGQRKRK